MIKKLASIIAICAFSACLGYKCRAITVWYDEDWNYRKKIEINPSKVEGDKTNFPIFINLNHLGTNFFTNARSDCGDIRITNEDGKTELPREIVSCYPGEQLGELWFLADELNGTATTTFYIYYGNSDSGNYNNDSPYGSEAVWASWKKIYHLDKNANDSTTNDKHGSESDIVHTDGIIGTSSEITVENMGIIEINDTTEISGTSDFTFSQWLFMPAICNNYCISASRRSSYPPDWQLTLQPDSLGEKIYFQTQWC